MLSDDDALSVLYASLYYYELFKQTLLKQTPEQITTKTQINVAVALFAHRSMNMRDLSEKISVAPEQVTRAVKALEECGIVVCERNPDNRREVIARLTDKGRSVIAGQLDASTDALREKLGALDQSEVDALVDASKQAATILGEADLRPIIPE